MSHGPQLEKFEKGPGMIGIPVFLVTILVVFITLTGL